MQRLRFVGPEGSPWPGRVLRAVGPTQTKIAVLQRLREETGIKIPELIQRVEQDAKEDDGLWAMAVTVFLAVNNAGFTMTLAEVQETFAPEDFQQADDAPAPSTAEPEVGPDPSSAPTASGPVDVAGAAPATVSRAKPKRSSTKR